METRGVVDEHRHTESQEAGEGTSVEFSGSCSVTKEPIPEVRLELGFCGRTTDDDGSLSSRTRGKGDIGSKTKYNTHRLTCSPPFVKMRNLRRTDHHAPGHRELWGGTVSIPEGVALVTVNIRYRTPITAHSRLHPDPLEVSVTGMGA